MKRGVGLYFDNAFPKRGLDPLTTSAYRLPDGRVQPSAGIWAHRDYLRTEVQAMKRRGWFNRLVRAARAYLNEKPVCGLLVLLALVAIGIAVWRSHL